MRWRCRARTWRSMVWKGTLLNSSLLSALRLRRGELGRVMKRMDEARLELQQLTTKQALLVLPGFRRLVSQASRVVCSRRRVNRGPGRQRRAGIGTYRVAKRPNRVLLKRRDRPSL